MLGLMGGAPHLMNAICTSGTMASNDMSIKGKPISLADNLLTIMGALMAP